MTFTYMRGILRAPDDEGAGGSATPAGGSSAAAPANPTPPVTPPAGSSDPKLAAPSATPKGTPPASPAEGSPAFTIPEAYKDKPWASKVKSMDDVYKQIDTLDALKGKKSIAPDFSKATPAEIEEYLSQTRPADVAAYEFGKDVDPGLNKVLGDSMLKFGVSAYQANGVIKAFQEAHAQQLTPESMMPLLEKSFGADWKTIGGAARNLVTANLSPEDAAQLDRMPSSDLTLIYRLANNLTKAYGITEKGGAHVGGGGGAPQPVDLDKRAGEIRTELDALSRKPHTVEDRDKLVNELDAIYKQKVKK